MSVAALEEYIRFSKYAKHLPEQRRRELWPEQVGRVFGMHRQHLGPEICAEISADLEFAESAVLDKKVLGSQRGLQFGGKPILDKNARLYNCTVSYCDRLRFFQEGIWLLLCGCGIGFSVQKHHIAKLPDLKAPDPNNKLTHVVEDSIEGWADAVGAVVSSYFDSEYLPDERYRGVTVEFDYSLVRPEGAPISSGNKAPGPKGLKNAIIKIDKLLKKACKLGNRIRTIDAYDIMMHASDAVLSGGIRRSATICMFSPDDQDMLTAKTGDWQIENPQRGRSNNSVVLIRSETSKEDFDRYIESVKEFGEPGFVWAEDIEVVYNPCVEIGMVPKLRLNDELRKRFAREILIQNNNEYLSGWHFCNLCETNLKKAKTPQEFYNACIAASIIGTIQASYTDFGYIGDVSSEIVKEEALLGVSMTGMADTPEVAFNPEVQRKAAKLILEVNTRIAKAIGVNECARGTCVKPAGTTSCLFGSATGIHDHHSRRYLKLIQANKLETPLQYFEERNPLAVEESVWSANGTDVIITFLCEAPEGSKTKQDVDAITLLNRVKLTQQNWVEYGTRHETAIYPWLRHNVSNTINVKDDEWKKVANHIYENRFCYAGISIVPQSSDKDYPQSPFTAVSTPEEIVSEYGDGSLFASGLIVDGLRAFNNNLWKASECAFGEGEILTVERLRHKIEEEIITDEEVWAEEGLTPDSPEKLLQAWLGHNVELYTEKIDWVRRAKQFAIRYFDGDVKKMTYCLKDIINWKKWCDLSRTYVDIDWSQCVEDEYGNLGDYGGGAGEACAGGLCELGDLGHAIRDSLAEEEKS
jgi:ribonucleoside-triphosphate reductase